MRMNALLLLLAVLLVGCQARPQADHAASAPKLIEALTDQTLVYSCPECGMDYDRAGKCDMCNVDLVTTRVAYICPADNRPVERSGKCPRCDANARVTKTAVAAEAPSPDVAPGGERSGSPGPGAAGSGAASGS